MVAVSIVIPVRNGASTLGAQFDALLSSIGGRDDVEVIVADNGSDDETIDLALDRAGSLNLRVVDASRTPGSNVARNDGVRAARGEHVLLCDADDEVDVAWVAEMSSALASGADLIAGPIDFRRLNSAEVRQWRGADRAGLIEPLDFLPAGHGANLGFARSTFDAIGGFDETYKYGGPDVEFCWRAQLAGFDLVEVPGAVVHYRLRQDLGALWRQFISYSACESQLYRDFREHGAHRRKLTAPLRDVSWLLTRLPFAVASGRRGAWLKRLAITVGRVRGAFRHRVVYW